MHGSTLAVLVCLTALSCARTDPTGGECANVLDCLSGSYCKHGACASDCSANQPCPADAACTPSGECLRLDQVGCEEGDAPGPPELAPGLPGPDQLLLSNLPGQCQTLVTARVVGSGAVVNDVPPAINRFCQSLQAVGGMHADLLGVPGLLGKCRPALLVDGRADWHALPTYLNAVALDTLMEVRWSGNAFELAIGAAPNQLGPPDPGTVWYSASGTLDGNLTGQVNANLIDRIVTNSYASQGVADDPTTESRPYEMKFSRAEAAGVVTLDEELDSMNEAARPGYRAHLRRQGDSLLAGYQSGAGANAAGFTLQLRDDLTGRLDLTGSTTGTICWSVEGQLMLLAFAKSPNGVFAEPSQCAFGDPP